MLVHKKTWDNFVLALDFKISPGCNSGIFVRKGRYTISVNNPSGEDAQVQITRKILGE